MTSQSVAQSRAVPIEDAEVAIGYVLSRDGTTIGYRQVGTGPALILLHGSMSSGAYHVDLARLLADTFTVILPDRRGRGLSGPYAPTDALEQELDDVAAVIEATGASRVWGLSSGGCIALRAARTMPAIAQVAVYEPPLLPDRAAATAVLREFDAEMAAGNVEVAMITAMRAAEMGPAFFRALPKSLTARLVRLGMAQEAKKPAGPYPKMRDLAPTLHADFAVVAESSGRLDDYDSINARVLLMAGSRSPAYLRQAIADLGRALPTASRVEIEGADHSASWNRDLRGRPEVVAPILRTFFEA